MTKMLELFDKFLDLSEGSACYHQLPQITWAVVCWRKVSPLNVIIARWAPIKARAMMPALIK